MPEEIGVLEEEGEVVDKVLGVALSGNDNEQRAVHHPREPGDGEGAGAGRHDPTPLPAGK